MQKAGIDALFVSSESNLRYITRTARLEGTVIILSTGEALFYTDSRYIEVAEKELTKYGITSLLPENGDVFGELRRICRERQVKTLGYEDAAMSVRQFEKLGKYISCDKTGISDIFSGMRSVKTEYESDSIEKAQRIAEKALDVILGEIRPGMTENECKARLDYLMSIYGSEKPAFETILISGAKTSMPHGEPDEKVIEKGDFITFDFGARVNGYCSDMTRTVAVGSASEKQREIYDIVLNAQLCGIEAVGNGKTGREIDKAARDVIEKAGYGKYFGHSTGHSVGLDIHEPPSASPKSDAVFAPGMLLTIEPGIYIPDLFGVRIEDMMLIGEKSNKNLTKFAKNLIII